MLIETLVVGPFQCNCMILADEKTKKAIIIDPGDDAPRILQVIKHHDLQVTHILHTHAHLDHIGATARVHQETGAPILLHRDDLWLYENLKMQGDLFALQTDPVKPVNQFLKDKEVVQSGSLSAKTLHTPGHTPGSVSFLFEKGLEDRDIVFSGDTLFQSGIGRTDLWGGSYETILSSIQDRLLTLNEETQVYPGHGPQTTIWNERKKNPFLQDLPLK